MFIIIYKSLIYGSSIYYDKNNCFKKSKFIDNLKKGFIYIKIYFSFIYISITVDGQKYKILS